MVFNSFAFMFFAMAFFVIFFLLPQRVKPVFILVASYIFYSFSKFNYIWLIFASSLVDFLVGIYLEKSKSSASRKMLLGLSIAVNLGMLGFFKYTNYFLAEAYGLMELFSIQPGYRFLNLILPVGLSFYTFQSMGYSIDVYRGKIKPEKNPLHFFNFVSFFPQLVAGPIESADRLIPQLKSKMSFSVSNFSQGSLLFIQGLAKKVLIADYLAQYVEKMYGAHHEVSSLNLILATYFFAFQILMDFSGYTDMAMGLAKILGVDLRENFRRPYLAASVKEFWRRWHISLTRWFREYLYIPLGGRDKYWRNVAIVFLLSGFWHGANFTFIFWGALNCSFFFLESKMDFLGRSKWPKALQIFVTFNLICLTWIFFRSANVGQGMSILSNIFTKGMEGHLALSSVFASADLIMLLVTSSIFVFRSFSEEFKLKPLTLNDPIVLGSLSIQLTLLIIFFSNEKPFLYFQF